MSGEQKSACLYAAKLGEESLKQVFIATTKGEAATVVYGGTDYCIHGSNAGFSTENCTFFRFFY